MNNFVEILQKAIAGDNEAINEILLLYQPLINRKSVVKGAFDEDCRQHIMLHIVKNIHKFDMYKFKEGTL